jgi:TonB family protein
MKRVALIVAAFAAASSAWAQSSEKMPPPPSLPPGSPASIGAPHLCLQDYPAEAVAAHAEGTTTVGFTITETGVTKDIRVVKSSGTPSLDTAAIMCANRWLYKPAVKDGAPIAVPWKAEVKWVMRGSPMQIVVPAPIGEHICKKPHGVKIAAGVTTTLKLRITNQGKVSDTEIQNSSGNTDLDEAAKQCALSWNYEPATINGIPAVVFLIEKFWGTGK